MYVGAFRIKYLPYVDISFKHQVIKRKEKRKRKDYESKHSNVRDKLPDCYFLGLDLY